MPEGLIMILTLGEDERYIDDFPNYVINDRGEIFNATTGRVMVLSPTQNGDLTVGLTRDKHQYRYSVKCLVARAFVEGESELFNTPVLLDGNKENLSASNIVWRPRWFAWKYTRQFTVYQNWYSFGPVYDRVTKTQYKSYFEASIANGILCSDIMSSIYNGKLTFPTWQKFCYVT
jgi:hypothetical protein